MFLASIALNFPYKNPAISAGFYQEILTSSCVDAEPVADDG